MHKITVWGVGILTGAMLIVAPFSASAVTIADLQNQLSSLLKQIAQLQSQTSVSVSGSGTTGSAISSPIQYRICNILNRNLFVGASGDDVSGLQEFLQGQGYLSVNPTGYFGPITAQAVAKWQASQGVSAVGAFGPASRGQLKIWCGGGGGGSSGGGVSNSLQATPSSGSSPLTVTFTPNVQIRFPSGDLGSYQIDFGDGQNQQLSCSNAASPAMPSVLGSCTSAPVTHTYQSDGTYTAVLETTPGNINPTAFTPNIVGKVQITVGASSQGTVSASPQSGASPLPVSFTYLPTSENGTYHIDYGDGSSDQMSAQQIQCFAAPCINPAIANHTYTTAGTYTVVVSPYIACMYTNPRCMIASIPLARTTVTVSGNGSATGAPVISGFSGPTTLSVGTAGTWTIQASDPANGNLSYNITWGDENSAVPMAAGMSANAAFVQTTTFTHAYASAGTYTVTVTVHDSSGLTAQTTTTVQVGSSVVCTADYSPVCGQPKGPTCSAGMMCPMYMLAPQTYSNRCTLDAAGATFLYNGSCTNGVTAY